MTPSQRALQYAYDVRDGEIVAGHYVKLACQRFLRDLDRIPNDDWPYTFDFEKADQAVEFQEKLPHVKDRWARSGDRLTYEPWQCFIECNVFGWIYKDGGLRRFRESYEEVARKNGKSTRMAGRGLYLFCAGDDFQSEIYAGATSEKQAWEVFRPARQMVQRTDGLRVDFDITVNAKSLVRFSDGSRFEPLIGKPGDGASVSGYICDEFHEHPDADQYETMKTGCVSRLEPLISIITTAGSNLAGPCYEKRQDAIRVLEGSVVDESMFAIIFCADDDDEWDSDTAIIKANPNLDVSVRFDALKINRDQARRSARAQNEFRTKHLNQWVGASVSWMNMLAWQRQKRKYDLAEFEGAPVWVGVDLASKKDLAAIAMLIPHGNEFQTHFEFFAPESTLDDNVKYRQLRDWVTFTPGNATDYAFIEQCLDDLARRFDVQSVAFDPWQAQYLMQRLQAQGMSVVEYPHQVRTMSDPMKEVEALILDRRLWHYNAAMDWMVSNTVVKLDQKDNCYPTKQNKKDPFQKIDGVVALIMAMGRYLNSHENGGLNDFLSNPVSRV